MGGEEGERGKGKGGRTYGNADLGRMATSQRSRVVSAAQRRRVSYHSPRQREANGSVTLDEENGHAQVRLLDIPTPVGLVRWSPDLLRDNVVHGHGEEIQQVEGDVIGQGVAANVADGRALDHQRVVPSGDVPDEINVIRVHLEEGFNEKRGVPTAEHPRKEPIAADEGDRCVHRVLVAIRRTRREDGGGILAYDMAKGRGYNTTKLRRSEESAKGGVGGRGRERSVLGGQCERTGGRGGFFTSCSGAGCAFATRLGLILIVRVLVQPQQSRALSGWPTTIILLCLTSHRICLWHRYLWHTVSIGATVTGSLAGPPFWEKDARNLEPGWTSQSSAELGITLLMGGAW